MTAARVATAVVLVPIVVAAVWWGSPGVVAVLTALATLLALMEFFALGERTGLNGFRLWTGVCALGVLFQQWAVAGEQTRTLGGGLQFTRVDPSAPQPPLELILFVFVLGAAAIVFFSRRPVGGALGDIAISAAGLVFIALPLATVIRLDGVTLLGKKMVLFTLTLVWAGDTLAYFVGRWFGRTRMAPALSPGKTWEGAAANLLGSLAVGLLFARWLDFDARDAVMMAGVGNIAGQAGDLIESAYKRSVGVKDSGALLPGHGGMLDRIDALILAAPAVWYYFHLVLGR